MTASGRLSARARLELGGLALAGLVAGFLALMLVSVGIVAIEMASPTVLDGRLLRIVYLGLVFSG